MANELRDHVWVIDTAGAANVTNETVLVTDIRWVGSTTAGHTAIIENGRSGVVVWESVNQNGANEVQESHDLALRLVEGFSVPTLASGRLYIYGKLY